MRNLCLKTTLGLGILLSTTAASAANYHLNVLTAATNAPVLTTTISTGLTVATGVSTGATPANLLPFLYDGTNFAAVLNPFIGTASGPTKVASYTFPAANYPGLPPAIGPNWYPLPTPVTVATSTASGTAVAGTITAINLDVMAWNFQITYASPTNANPATLVVNSFNSVEQMLDLAGTLFSIISLGGGNIPANIPAYRFNVAPYGHIIGFRLVNTIAAAAPYAGSVETYLVNWYCRYSYI